MNAIDDMKMSNHSAAPIRQKSSIGIRGRLIIGFSAIVIIFLIAISITVYSINAVINNSTHVISVQLPAYDAFLDLNGHIYESQLNTQNIILNPSSESKNALVATWGLIDKEMSELDVKIKKADSESYLNYWYELKTLIATLKDSQIKLSTSMIATNSNPAAIKALNDEITPIFQKVSNLLNIDRTNNNESKGILDYISTDLDEGANNIISSLNLLKITEYILTIIGIIASILIALFTARSIIKHINIFREYSSRIASGDLSQSVAIESFDEIGQLGNDLNMMTSSLAAMTHEITSSCHNMVTTLEEVRHAIDVQSSGASEQASSVHEITASLSEIEKSSNQTMQKAKSLGKAAERTREKGQQGLEAVDLSVNGMRDIREKVETIAQTILDLSNKTQQIGEITSAVNNLAQQSKMLALNASIEAAKAGEAGKGFAVVAVEVKSLAEQSEQATTQVQKILEDIRYAAEKAVMVTEEGTKGVDHGTSLVEQTGDIIRSLNEVIHETTIATQQIESAIRQEGAGIEQITTAMNEINQVTTNFLDSVRQTTEAMSNLALISKNLKSYVDRYKI